MKLVSEKFAGFMLLAAASTAYPSAEGKHFKRLYRFQSQTLAASKAMLLKT